MLLASIQTTNPTKAREARAPAVDVFTVSTTETTAAIATTPVNQEYQRVVAPRSATTATLPTANAIHAPSVAPTIWLPSLRSRSTAGSGWESA